MMPYASNGTISTDEIAGGIEISNEQYQAALVAIAAGKAISVDAGLQFIEPDVPDDENPPPQFNVAVVYAVHLWERLTEEEADQVGEAIQGQSFRTQNIFRSANSYRSDHPLWPLLQQITTELFGSVRAAELLAPSAYAEAVPAS